MTDPLTEEEADKIAAELERGEGLDYDNVRRVEPNHAPEHPID
ncbi:MAG: hypothetical protein AAGF73_11655 [Actinomycetota bacterium]